MSTHGDGASAAVTVIVPGFDVGPYAAEALESLRRQSFGDWVAVLVDDASTDATATVFAAAAAADPRFRLVRHARRRGLGAARNTGLDRVRTPFVAFLDADDAFVPGALQRLIGVLGDTGSDFAAGAYVRLRPDGTGGYAAGEVQPWVAAATDPERRSTTIDQHPEATGNVVAWSKVSRADFWARTGLRFPEGRLYEDQVVAQQMYTRARRFDVVPDIVAQWRVRPDGSSITQREAQLSVLRECLAAMADGLAVLDAAGHPAAAEARVGQMLRMDVPRLAEIARRHPDADYRRALGAFTRTLHDRPGRHPGGTAVAALAGDHAAGAAVAAALLW